MADNGRVDAVVHKPAVGVLEDENNEESDLVDWTAERSGKRDCEGVVQEGRCLEANIEQAHFLFYFNIILKRVHR